MNYVSGTWTLSKEHEKNDSIDAAQKCSTSSYKRKENTRTRFEAKMRTKRMRKWVKLEKWMMEMKMKKTREALKMKLMMDTAQTQIAFMTPTSP